MITYELREGDIFRGSTWADWYTLMKRFPSAGGKNIEVLIIKCDERGKIGRGSQSEHYSVVNSANYYVSGNVVQGKDPREADEPASPPLIMVGFTQAQIDALLEALEDQPEWEDVSKVLLGALSC